MNKPKIDKPIAPNKVNQGSFNPKPNKINPTENRKPNDNNMILFIELSSVPLGVTRIVNTEVPKKLSSTHSIIAL